MTCFHFVSKAPKYIYKKSKHVTQLFVFCFSPPPDLLESSKYVSGSKRDLALCTHTYISCGSIGEAEATRFFFFSPSLRQLLREGERERESK